MANFWIYRSHKKIVVQHINKILKKYVGHKTDPLEDLVADLRADVLRYFKANPETLKYFVDRTTGSMDYNFEIQELGGAVVSVEFCPVD